MLKWAGEPGMEKFLMQDTRSSDERIPIHTLRDEELLLAARLPVSVLLSASGGDERAACARFIHDHSTFQHGPFIAVHCVGVPVPAVSFHEQSDLPIPQLSGYMENVERWFEEAAGGTLFIDDIGELSPLGQEALFWRLEQNTLWHLHATGLSKGSRVRVIAGASHALRGELAKQTFCAELFYRLNVIHIDLANRFDEWGDLR